MLTRRRFMHLAGAGGGALALGAAASPAARATPEPVTLRAGAGRVPLVDSARPSAVWAYNDTVPGPLLRVAQGSTLRVRLANDLPIGTTVHWHGLRLDNAMDGAGHLTQAPVETGAHFDYLVRAPDAGTFWYHPHFRSAEAVARGLYGVLIVEETLPAAVDRDIALVLDDWRLSDDGEIDVASFGNLHDAAHQGRLGNVLTVNGEPAPTLIVAPGERLRLRLLNAANSRVMNIDLGTLQAHLVALDGQPVAPAARRRVLLAPGQRADLIADVAASAPDPELRVITRGGETPAVLLRAAAPPLRGQPLAVPGPLPANPLPRDLDLDGAARVDLLMQGGAMGGLGSARYQGREQDLRALARQGMVWAFNGEVGMPERPLFSAPRGRTVRLRLVNDTRWPHAMHLHGHHALTLDEGEHEPRGLWRDTVLLAAGETLEIGFVADNPGRWMLHCHMLEHQAAGMATWFEVV